MTRRRLFTLWIVASATLAGLAVGPSLNSEASMARYTLTQSQREVLVSWLFEPGGYLDAAVNDAGQSARQALAADPNLDVTVWIRTNTKGADVAQSDWDACAMVWWIWKHENINIRPQDLPPETPIWLALLDEWSQSIVDGFARISKETRDGSSTVNIYDASGLLIGAQFGGTHLENQNGSFIAVTSVLR